MRGITFISTYQQSPPTSGTLLQLAVLLNFPVNIIIAWNDYGIILSDVAIIMIFLGMCYFATEICITDLIWFHIRGVGGWTNKLYEYFKREQIKQREFEHHSLRPASLFVSSDQSVVQTNVSFGNQSATIASAKNATENQPPFRWTKTRRPYK
jgi:hypothetical protein